jgi:demethylmenaquinone methyltransferase/2-methoxy-6-polyprenyl-1,4-benzoquinol methylase
MGILENKARARLFYRYLSKVYDRVNPFIWNEEMREEALDLVGIQAGDRVLDVGCGTGFATEGILRRTDDVHGLDQSVHQMQKAFAKFGKRDRVDFYRGDAERLPFADDAFDVVWSSGSIEYWPNPVDALVEFRRVCKPGGKVLVVGPDQPKTSLFSKLADAIMLFYDEQEADRMFAAAGFAEFEHHIQQARPGSPRAITTLARVPAEPGSELEDRSAVDRDRDRNRDPERERDPASGATSDAGAGSASSADPIGD